MKGALFICSGIEQRLKLNEGDEMPKKLNLGETSEKGNTYFIKNKDRVLGSFRWTDDELAQLDQGFVGPEFISTGLNGWLKSRTPPKHRAYMDRLLKLCGLSSTRSVLDYSKGLSLNDCLWVTQDPETSWASVNLFDNPFDKVIARVAFDGGVYGMPFSTTSPEFGTDGMLPKCWVRTAGKIYLHKGGTRGACNAGYEPLSEVLAHQVLTRLGYPHVPYTLNNFQGNRVSTCPLFTSPEVSYLPIYRAVPVNVIEDIMVASRALGFEKALAQQLIFDYLSFNTDRHAGNFGCLVDPETFEVQGMAPIFDNGMSMMCLWNGEEDMDEYCLDRHKRPALYDTYEEGALWGKRIIGREHNVESLIGFEFDLTQIGDYSVDRVLAIQKWFQRRVRAFLKL